MDQHSGIPREMELDTEEVILRRDGRRLVIEPVPRTPLLELLAKLEPIREHFPEVAEGLQPFQDVDL